MAVTARCAVCGLTKPVDAFPLLARPSDQGRDGRSRRCLDCRAAGRKRDHRQGARVPPERASSTAGASEVGETKACQRCGRRVPVEHFRRSGTGYTSRLCEDCRRLPRFRGARRPPLRAPAADQPDDGLSPRERAQHEMRVFAMALVRQQLD